MGIFDSGKSQKNKVYYRRKSIRLQNYALGLTSFAALCFAFYFVSQRGQLSDEGVD